MTLAQTQLIKDNYVETDTSESNEASSNLNTNFANIGASEGNDASLNPNEIMMHTCSLKSLTVHWPRTCQNSKPLDNKRVEMPRLGCHDYLIWFWFDSNLILIWFWFDSEKYKGKGQRWFESWLHQPNLVTKIDFIETNILTYFIKRSLFIHRIAFERDYILCHHPKNMGLCASWSSNSYKQDQDSLKVNLQVSRQVSEASDTAFLFAASHKRRRHKKLNGQEQIIVCISYLKYFKAQSFKSPSMWASIQRTSKAMEIGQNIIICQWKIGNPVGCEVECLSTGHSVSRWFHVSVRNMWERHGEIKVVCTPD